MNLAGRNACITLLAAAALAYCQDPPRLWYREPAKLWVEALPVGNGRLGAMVFGGITHERIQFNEQTVWTGAPHDYAHHGAYRSLGRIRELLWAGKQKEAEDLATREFMSVPLRQSAYQAFGDVVLEFPGIREGEVREYRRELNLDTAVAAVEYRFHEVRYRREVFASHPAGVIVIRLTASQPGSLSFETTLKSAHEPGSAVTARAGQGTGAGRLPPEIAMPGGVAGGAIRFEARLVVRTDGGTVERKGEEPVWVVSGANSATLILAGATNFKNYRDVTADAGARNDATLAAVRTETIGRLRAEHVADHQRLFRRVSLDLGAAAPAVPTDERIQRFAADRDPALVALLFQFGRYLLIASSRPGGQPANLQGLWNESNHPPWDSKYTDNINTEMNYWPAEETNLAECQLPLFDALKDLAESGAITAREQYHAGGWVLHHNFDLWRGTAPINASNHGIWQTGGAWLATHLWEHYRFTGDRQFLRETAYPLMKGAAQFFVDTLVRDPESGMLITGPSNSPEQGGLVMGPTMDRQIVRSLFGEVIAASGILGVDEGFRAQLGELRPRIAPNRVGRHGQLQEWLEDKDDPANQHRHVSHLWGVYPGGEITPYGTPDLFGGAKQSLVYRGDAATGWSMGWKINLWARFLDGDHAYKILQNLITPASDKPAHAGLYANLFDAHPPFQIDGNFGATAGITEMLLQSTDPYATPVSLTRFQKGEAAFVSLLPALPAAFPDGNVSGLKARGGLTVSISWRHGKLQKATLRATESQPVKVRYGGREVEISAKKGGSYEVGPDLKVRGNR